jgi:hypothetical protein
MLFPNSNSVALPDAASSEAIFKAGARSASQQVSLQPRMLVAKQ